MKNTKTNISAKRLEQVAKILKTIAHPVKLDILELLGEHNSLSVSSLCEMVDSDCEISMMSHHLAKMKDNGILVSEKEGKQVYYSIADRNLLKIFNCIDNCNFE
jgi:ArsR family transcriptional regulator